MRKGFTLIELMLYVGLISILLLAISVFLGVLLSARIKSQVIAEVNEQGVHAMNQITQAIRNADSIVGPTNTAASSTLTLAVSAPYNPTIFNLFSDAIMVQEGASSSVALTNNRVVASDLTFQNLSNTASSSIVRIQFTLAAATSSNRLEYIYSRTFYAGATTRP